MGTEERAEESSAEAARKIIHIDMDCEILTSPPYGGRRLCLYCCGLYAVAQCDELGIEARAVPVAGLGVWAESQTGPLRRFNLDRHRRRYRRAPSITL
jgi:hypothetical protein